MTTNDGASASPERFLPEDKKPTELSEKDLALLAWFADVPLFIDSQRIEAFYNGVIRPETTDGTVTLKLSGSESRTTTLGAHGEAGISLGKLLSFLPGLDVKVAGDVGSEHAGTSGFERTVELHPIATPERQLLHLVAHYFVDKRDRLCHIVRDQDHASWSTDAFISGIPRPIVLLDLGRGTKFLPVTAELEKGKIVYFFKKLTQALSVNASDAAPEYLEWSANLTAGQLEQGRLAYWHWHEQNFRDREAMETLEQIVAEGEGRISWIDFRVPVGSDVYLHLHFGARGTFDTGAFSYNLIRRGWEQGIRLVGTLKTGPDVDVLAVFEK